MDAAAVPELSAKGNRFWRLPLSGSVADRKRSKHRPGVLGVAKSRACGHRVARPESIERRYERLDASSEPEQRRGCTFKSGRGPELMPSYNRRITSNPCERCANAPSGMRFYDRHVRGVYNATGVHIRAEVAAAYRLTNLSFGLRDVGGVDYAVAVCVADEHVHARWRVRQNLGEFVGHAGQCDGERLHVRDTGQVHRHGVTGKGRHT